MKRRTLLAGGAAVTLLTVGGGVWRAVDRGVFSAGTGPAYQPWKDWEAAARSGPLAIVHAAILAANPHNTQPWVFRVGERRIELLADTSRNLGDFDPFLREMYLGLGCAIENMVLASRAEGYAPSVTMVPGRLDESDTTTKRLRRVATVTLAPAARRRDELYDAIGSRHTDRGPYDTARPLGEETLLTLSRLQAVNSDGSRIRTSWWTDAPDKARLGRIIIDATDTIIADADMVRDSERWFRFDWDALQRERDGVTLDSGNMSPVMTAIAKMLPPTSAETNHRFWRDATADVHVPTAAALGVIAVPDLYDVATTLAAGRSWQRLHLAATAQGIAMQPLNQPVEVVDRDHATGRAPDAAGRLSPFAGGDAWRPTFVFRAGYSLRPAGPSPRRALAEVVRGA